MHESQAARAQLMALDLVSIPVTVVDDQVVVGFGPEQVSRLQSLLQV